MCCSKGLLKRFVPFFATFAFGMLIASFFVTVAAPSFRFGNGLRRTEHRSCWRMENQRFREEDLRFRQQAAENDIRQNPDFSGDINELVPPPPPLPVAPRRVR
ncbi:MAG: hypothetical protein ACR2N3_19305 [Pyrinomonadaceae bacterium]